LVTTKLTTIVAFWKLTPGYYSEPGRIYSWGRGWGSKNRGFIPLVVSMPWYGRDSVEWILCFCDKIVLQCNEMNSSWVVERNL